MLTREVYIPCSENEPLRGILVPSESQIDSHQHPKDGEAKNCYQRDYEGLEVVSVHSGPPWLRPRLTREAVLLPLKDRTDHPG